MNGTKDFLEELQNSGPRDIYEITALTHDTAEALEFLVRACQQKDQLIQLLARPLRNEAGDGYWQRYVNQVKYFAVPNWPPTDPLSPSETLQAGGKVFNIPIKF